MSNRSQTYTHTPIVHTLVSASQKKTYQSPQLSPVGSVRELTLKLGSISDGMSPHQQ